MLRKIRRGALLGAAAFAVAGTAYSQNEQFVPMNGYWVGPYAAGGSGIFGGLIDYMQMINARDGGINGVKVTWEKCETEYNNARGVECYERTKKRGRRERRSCTRFLPASPIRSSIKGHPITFPSCRSATAALTPPTGACFRGCSRSSPITGARTPSRSSSSA